MLSHSALCYTDHRRPPVPRNVLYLSFDAVGGFCPEKKMFGRYTIDNELSSKLRNFAAPRKHSDMPINLLELCGMVFTAWCLVVQERELPENEGDPILMREGSVSAVCVVDYRRGGSCDTLAGLFIRLLGRLELTSGWCLVAKPVPGVGNVLADGISRWPRHEVAREARRLAGLGWAEVNLGNDSQQLFDSILAPSGRASAADEQIWRKTLPRPFP